METWFTVSLGDGITSAMPLLEIEAYFLRLFNAAGQPSDMAVFTRAESEGRLHCEIFAYFSPSALEVANAWAAQPCEKPAREGLALLAGDPHCWSVLFSDMGASAPTDSV